MDDAEVLVVGAGPTGLALACDLRQRGVDAQVIEQREGPSTTSRAFALQPRGLEILEDVGAGSISRRTAVIGGVTAHAGGQPLVRLRLDRLAHSGHPGVYFVSQADVEAELRDRLRHLGGEVAFAHELEAARHEDGRVVATVRHEQRDIETRAAWLAGCDGAHSTVREHAGITFEGESFPETFLLADLELERPGQHREVSAFIHGDGPTAFFPLPDDNTFRFIAQIGDDVVVPDDPGEVIRLCKDLLEHRAGRREPGISGCLWSSRFQIHRRLAARYRSGRMLLAGDAAHVHSPFGGQGKNVGLGDASNLGWKLAQVLRGSAGERLLDSYEGERRPVARQIVGLTTSATRTVTSGQRAALTFRNRVLPMLARTGKNGGAVELAGPRLFVERFAQLRVSYRGGPLVAPRSPRDRLAAAVRPGPEPGDRAPD